MEKVYVEPQVEAKNSPSGSYVAGCPENTRGLDGHDSRGPHGCLNCERTK